MGCHCEGRGDPRGEARQGEAERGQVVHLAETLTASLGMGPGAEVGEPMSTDHPEGQTRSSQHSPPPEGVRSGLKEQPQGFSLTFLRPLSPKRGCVSFPFPLEAVWEEEEKGKKTAYERDGDSFHCEMQWPLLPSLSC